MYATGNPKTKKALRDKVAAAVAHAADPTAPRAFFPGVFSPGPFPAPTDGPATIEGPQYPELHRWYARVELKGGQIVRVIG